MGRAARLPRPTCAECGTTLALLPYATRLRVCRACCEQFGYAEYLVGLR